MSRINPRRVRLAVPGFDAAAAFAALSAGARRAFLLERCGWAGEPESACIGWGPSAVLKIVDGRLSAEGLRVPAGGNPLEALGRALEGLGRADAGPAWAGGAIGYLAYEAVRHLEPVRSRSDLREEALVMVFDEALVHDYRDGSTEFVSWRGSAPEKVEAAARALRARQAHRSMNGAAALPWPPAGALGRRGFLAGVRRLKEHIRAGDIFQCVLSEQFRVRTRVAALDLYRALRAMNPSPYHFLIQDGSRAFVGSSPERLVRVDGRRVLYSPIAGTRPRGKTGARDRELERALKRSPKEKAEHLMLVDLGRNDLGRVCEPGSVRVARYMDVRRFSRVMHLVSELEGRLEKGRTGWDVLMAAFPAGTVTGAPKVRAMQLLRELEPKARGFYSGTVLQRDWLGNLDSCIALRSALVEEDAVVLQAGAGIVADSSPEREYQEVLHKLEAGRRALAAALGAGR